MEIFKGKTSRGFNCAAFEDIYGAECSIQKSSLADDEAIWFGVDDAAPKVMASTVREGLTGWVKYPLPDGVNLNTRMHLSREQVNALLPILQRFVDAGDIE